MALQAHNLWELESATVLEPRVIGGAGPVGGCNGDYPATPGLGPLPLWQKMVGAWCILAGTVALFVISLPGAAAGLELCEPRSKELMTAVGITARQIERLCHLAERESRVMKLAVRRSEDELGYCSVTLSLQNDSIHPVDSFILTTSDSRFELFRFYEVLPGSTGFATARSRTLLACDELEELGINLIWPAAARVAGRTLRGRQLKTFRPVLLSEVLRWGR